MSFVDSWWLVVLSISHVFVNSRSGAICGFKQRLGRSPKGLVVSVALSRWHPPWCQAHLYMALELVQGLCWKSKGGELAQHFIISYAAMWDTTNQSSTKLLGLTGQNSSRPRYLDTCFGVLVTNFLNALSLRLHVTSTSLIINNAQVHVHISRYHMNFNLECQVVTCCTACWMMEPSQKTRPSDRACIVHPHHFGMV